jgi:hypothetical protein
LEFERENLTVSICVISEYNLSIVPAHALQPLRDMKKTFSLNMSEPEGFKMKSERVTVARDQRYFFISKGQSCNTD